MTEQQPMAEPRPSHTHDERKHSPEERTVAHRGAHQQINRFVESSRLLPFLMLIALLAGVALMGQFWAISEARDAKRAAEVNTMRVEGLTRAMIAHGIKDTYPHLPGEDD
jgi:hypothetical protein